jgi:hypothetical protein
VANASEPRTDLIGELAVKLTIQYLLPSQTGRERVIFPPAASMDFAISFGISIRSPGGVNARHDSDLSNPSVFFKGCR